VFDGALVRVQSARYHFSVHRPIHDVTFRRQNLKPMSLKKRTHSKTDESQCPAYDHVSALTTSKPEKRRSGTFLSGHFHFFFFRKWWRLRCLYDEFRMMSAIIIVGIWARRRCNDWNCQDETSV